MTLFERRYLRLAYICIMTFMVFNIEIVHCYLNRHEFYYPTYNSWQANVAARGGKVSDAGGYSSALCS